MCHGGLAMAHTALPRDWFYCDAPYVGGAEVYLQWHLEFAGAEAPGLLALDTPGLHGWLQELEERGILVRRLSRGDWRARLRADRSQAKS